jgi:hypothetical protein
VSWARDLFLLTYRAVARTVRNAHVIQRRSGQRLFPVAHVCERRYAAVMGTQDARSFVRVVRFVMTLVLRTQRPLRGLSRNGL